MQFSRIDHVALDVSNLQNSIDFYSRHFGFRHYFDQKTPTGLKIGYLKLGSTVLELVGKKVRKRDGRLPLLSNHRRLRLRGFDIEGRRHQGRNAAPPDSCEGAH